MRTLAERLRLPAWVDRVDPVAWFPVFAFVVVAVLCVMADNLWLAFAAVAAGVLIVVLEAKVFGPGRLNPPQQPRPPARPTRPAPPAPPARHHR
jgi:hypothetical protein